MIFDLLIAGAGPAGCAAAVYSARKQLKTIIVAEEIGGQSVVSDKIFNWVGTKSISGPELAKNLHEHIKEYSNEKGTLEISLGKKVEKIEKSAHGFIATLSDGNKIETKSVLVTTGSRRRKLDIPGAKEFDNKGVMYCATCDGPLFFDMSVAVIGGGNAGFEAAAQLAQYAKDVTLLNRSDVFKADEITVQAVLKNPKIKVLKNVELKSIEGNQFVESIVYEIAGEKTTLPVSALFVEIGQLPNTELAKDVADLDSLNRIIVNPKNQRASTQGVWAAGDCTDGLYHQNNIASGDAIKAIEDLYIWIKRGEK